jgi:hypothetical protein
VSAQRSERLSVPEKEPRLDQQLEPPWWVRALSWSAPGLLSELVLVLPLEQE